MTSSVKLFYNYTVFYLSLATTGAFFFKNYRIFFKAVEKSCKKKKEKQNNNYHPHPHPKFKSFV